MYACTCMLSKPPVAANCPIYIDMYRLYRIVFYICSCDTIDIGGATGVLRVFRSAVQVRTRGIRWPCIPCIIR